MRSHALFSMPDMAGPHTTGSPLYIARILEKVLYEFPVSQIQFFIPRWVEMLPLEHELKQQILSQIRDKMKSMQHIRDITKESVKLSGPYVQDSLQIGRASCRERV